MMMPANFSAVAENELTYVVGGASLVDYLAPAMTTENWQNVSANVIKIVGNTFLQGYVSSAFDSVFDGNSSPATSSAACLTPCIAHTTRVPTPTQTALGALAWAS